MNKKRGELIIIILLFLLAIPQVFALAITTSSYSVESFHVGTLGDKGATTNYGPRDTIMYNQGSNKNGVTKNYKFNSGWLNITVTANDPQMPSILSTTASPILIYLGQLVNVYSTVSDNVQIDSCIVNIIQPNGSVGQASNACSNSQMYTPTQLGRHNLTFIVNDTKGNAVFNGDDYFIVADAINFTLTANDSKGGLETELSLIYPPTKDVIHLNNTKGTYTATLPQEVYNLLFKAFTNRVQITLRNVNITLDNNKTFGMDKLTTPASGYLATYGVNNNYTFDNATVMIYYDDLTYTNEANVKLYKCNDWNFMEQSCL